MSCKVDITQGQLYSTTLLTVQLSVSHRAMKMNGQVKDSGPTCTTSRVKKVSFADLVGLKLEFVRTITPCSSGDNLCSLDDDPVWQTNCDNTVASTKRVKFLYPCFVQPSESTDSFMERVYTQNVCLEYIVCNNLVITGLIRVTNLSYMKEVTVRFTLNGWETYRDIWADFMSTCSDGRTETFTFRISVTPDFEVNRKMEFAIRYRVSDKEFWDNNDRSNYHVRCLESELVPQKE